MTNVLALVRRAVAERALTADLDSTVNVHAYPPPNYVLPAVLIIPASGTYVDYHGTFGPGALQTINLLARVLVGDRGSHSSADEYLDSILSSGSDEGRSLHDVILGAGVTIGSTTADIHVGEAANWLAGKAEIGGQAVDVVSCDLPITVRLKRTP